MIEKYPAVRRDYRCWSNPNKKSSELNIFQDVNIVGNFDSLMSHGFRRSGYLFTKLSCTCNQCYELRIDIDKFDLSKSQKAVLKKCKDIVVTTNSSSDGVIISHDMLKIYCEYQKQFEDESVCSISSLNVTLNGYKKSMVLSYLKGSKLVGVAVLDIGNKTAYASSCFYDRGLTKLSLGIYSILKEIEYCKTMGIKYLYLGTYYKGESDYKLQFSGIERLFKGSWEKLDPTL